MNTPHFKPQEIAHRAPGKSWKRTTCRTSAAFDKKIAALTERGCEIRVRDAWDEVACECDQTTHICPKHDASDKAAVARVLASRRPSRF